MINKTLLGLAAGGAALFAAAPATAQQYFVGQAIIFGFDFCPEGTLPADGSLQSIANYQQLYTLLGTTYGGDGQQTFALPDLRGRSPVHVGHAPGLASYTLGQSGGSDTVRLTVNQMPSHTHQAFALAVDGAPTIDNPTNASLANLPAGQKVYSKLNPPDATMMTGTVAVQPVGNSGAFSNRAPFLVLRICIVAEGVFPPQ